jgi:photosystem II stability/assembly factor-like uncharacterized protein
VTVVAPPPQTDLDERTLDERVAGLEALIEEARQRTRRRRRRNGAVALAALLAAGAALYVGGEGIRAGDARSANDDAASAAAPDRPGAWTTPTGPPGFSAGVVLHPTRPRALYLYAGGRVYRSTNGGRSWKSGAPIALRLDALTVDPRDGSILYAGTDDGVLKSTDAGRTWRRSGLRPSPGGGRGSAFWAGWVFSIAVDPADSRNVYATTRGLRKTVAFRSRDAGATWQAMRPSTLRNMREIHAAGSGVLYTAGSYYREVPDGVLRSTDGGATWRSMLDGVWSIAVDPNRAGTVWAVGEHVLRVTRDGGMTWRSPGIAPVDGFPAITLDPRSPRTLYLSTPQNGVYRSVDGGRTWRPFGANARPGRGPRLTELLAIDPRTPATLYAGDGSGVVATMDGGATWRRADAGVVASHVTRIVPAAGNPTTIYTGGWIERGGVWRGATLSRSDDRGHTWKALQNGGTGAVAWQTNTGSLAVDPRDHRHVLVGRRGEIIGSRDGGATWTSLLRRAPDDVVGAIAFVPGDPRQVYAVVYTAATDRSVVIRSMDGGRTWQNHGGAGIYGIYALAVHPRRAETVFVGVGEGSNAGVATSSDGGRSWRFRSMPDGVVSLAVAPSDPDTLYAATGGGLARSVDGGDRWQLLPQRMMATDPLTVVVDPQRSDTVYVGIGEHGLFRSTDGGATLRPFGARLPRQEVWSLAFDPSGTWLYAGLKDAGLTWVRVR